MRYRHNPEEELEILEQEYRLSGDTDLLHQLNKLRLTRNLEPINCYLDLESFEDYIKEKFQSPWNQEADYSRWRDLLDAANRNNIQLGITGLIAPGTTNPYFSGILVDVTNSSYGCQLWLQGEQGVSTSGTQGSIFANEVVQGRIKVLPKREEQPPCPDHAPESRRNPDDLEHLQQQAELTRDYYDIIRYLAALAQQGNEEALHQFRARTAFHALAELSQHTGWPEQYKNDVRIIIARTIAAYAPPKFGYVLRDLGAFIVLPYNQDTRAELASIKKNFSPNKRYYHWDGNTLSETSYSELVNLVEKDKKDPLVLAWMDQHFINNGSTQNPELHPIRQLREEDLKIGSRIRNLNFPRVPRDTLGEVVSISPRGHRLAHEGVLSIKWDNTDNIFIDVYPGQVTLLNKYDSLCFDLQSQEGFTHRLSID